MQISVYNAAWPDQFEQEKIKLLESIGCYLFGTIEHVGSTAVPGLMAKPVIDIMFGVESLVASKPAIEKLIAMGYCHAPYKENLMHWFCKPSEHVRTHHLHLVPYNSELWHERIRFRNVLRQNPAIALDYQALKLQLADQFPQQRELYTQKKWPFIQRVLSTDNIDVKTGE